MARIKERSLKRKELKQKNQGGNPMTEVAYYTLEQASKILQISESTIRRRINSGEIPKARFSGKILIPAWFIKQGFERDADNN